MDQDNNDFVDNIDDIINDDINWLVNDVKQYANSSISNNNNHMNNRRSTHRRTTQIHRVSDNELKNYMQTYNNFTLTKTLLEKKPMNPNEIIRDKLVEVLATVGDDDSKKDMLVNQLLSQIENTKRQRRESRLKQFEVAFGKSITPQIPTERRKSTKDTFNRASIYINNNSNDESNNNNDNIRNRSNSILRTSISSSTSKNPTPRGSFRLNRGSISIINTINNNNNTNTNEMNMDEVLARASQIQEEEEQKRLALEKEKEQAFKNMITFISCIKALKIFRSARIIASSQKRISIAKVTRVVSNYRVKVNGGKLWKLFSSSIRIWLKLRLLKKKLGLRLIQKFVNDFSTVYGARVLKRYKHYRAIVKKQLMNYIQVTRARIELIGLYWDKVERNYRYQCYAASRDIEKQKRKELEAYLKTLDKSSIEGRWNLVGTHQQQYMFQLDNVQVQFQKANEGYFKEPGSEKWIEIKSRIIKKKNDQNNNKRNPNDFTAANNNTNNNDNNNNNNNNNNKKKNDKRPIDSIDPKERHSIIRSELAKKREVLKVRRMQSEQKQMEVEKADTTVDTNMAKTLLSCEGMKIYDQAVVMAEIVQKQLETCKKIGLKKVDIRTVRKNYTMNLLTDTELGKPWKQIIAEYVELDMKKKKEMMQKSAPVETSETKKADHILLQPGGGRFIVTSNGRKIKIAGAK